MDEGGKGASGEGGHSCPPPYVIARNEAISLVIPNLIGNPVQWRINHLEPTNRLTNWQ
ncbi:MAG: hypothetical protein ACTSRU_16280 [Candidatus Hodarchaeales archaeon]